MIDPPATRILRTALFVLVPAAYLSMKFWRPYVAVGGRDLFPVMAVFMALVFLVSAGSWNRHRTVALLGLVACFLWVAVVLLPVL